MTGSDLTALGSVELGDDADNVRIEEGAHRVWVGYGSGSLAAIDVNTRHKVADIPLSAHPESFRLDPGGSQIFVNLPRAREIAVVDRSAAKQVVTWKTDLLLANFPLILDDAGQVLSVFRFPARLAVYRKQDGQRVQESSRHDTGCGLWSLLGKGLRDVGKLSKNERIRSVRW
jgi:hypothetical protein